MDGRTAAAVLGITQGATRDEIRRAFRARAKLAHPDAHGTDEAFVTLRAAADLLLAAAPQGPAPQATFRTEPAAPVAPAPAAPGAAAVDAATAPATAPGGPAASACGAVGGRAGRWDHRPPTRPGAAIDLTDRPVAPRPHRAPAAAQADAAAAFARVLDAELARR